MSLYIPDWVYRQAEAGDRERVIAAPDHALRTNWGDQGRVKAWARAHRPSSSRGWAAALGLGTAPAVVAALMIHTVFSFEQVTLGSLLSFVGFKLSGWWTTGVAWLEGWAGSVPGLARGLDVLQVLGASPTLLAAIAALSSVTVLGAAWILYRNLIVPTGEEGRYAQVSL